MRKIFKQLFNNLFSDKSPRRVYLVMSPGCHIAVFDYYEDAIEYQQTNPNYARLRVVEVK